MSLHVCRILPWSPMKSSLTRTVSGFLAATFESSCRKGEPTLPVCIASSIFSSHTDSPPERTSSPCSRDHGCVRSLCGRRGKNHAKSSHGRSKTARFTVEANMAGGSLLRPPGQRVHVRLQLQRSPGIDGTRGSSLPATTRSCRVGRERASE